MENWKSIDEYENYEISDHGNVKNIKTNKMLKPSIDGHGYYKVGLYKNKIRTTSRIRKLVAQAFLTNHDDKLCVDHIDRNRLNNHISNLRYATKSENGMNQSKRSDNTSGIKGVNFHKTNKKWRAQITKDGRKIFLGYFESKEEAIEARSKAEEKYFKEFRAQNIYNISNSTVNININNS